MSGVYHASCHCGAVRIRFHLKGRPEDVHRCDCSLCRRVKSASLSAEVADVELLQGNDVLGLYQFGTKTARHYFCKTCGTHTHHQRRSDPSEMGINAGCVEGLPPRFAEGATWVDGVNHPSDN